MSLTFYFAPMSTASTVHWSLEELGIPYEAVKVDLKDPADKQKKLGPINPNLKVPVLVHDGTVVFESAAIQIYLGETFGVDKGLFPAPGRERGEALKWLVWTNVSLGDAVGRWQRNAGEYFPAEQRNAAAGVAGRKDLDQLIGVFEQELGDKSYVLGERISLVDFHLASFFQWMGFLGVDLTPFPKTKAWFERCSARPALAKLGG
jgi:glutathione S-transferase